MVNIVSINVNGLRDGNKFESFCKYGQENHFDIIGVQETFWDDDIVKKMENFWDGKIYFSCANIARRGVAFLISNRVKNDVHEVQGFDGRCIHIKFQQDDKEIDIINCYVPNILRDKISFYEQLIPKLPRSENMILLGDMNASLSRLDRCGRSAHTEDKAYKQLMHICDQFNIYDIWRARNPTARIFSWRRVVENILVQSRIDFIFTSKLLSQFVKNVYYKHNTFSDHSSVVMRIDFSEVERGAGVWILNNSLLEDKDYVDKISKLIENEKTCRLYNDEPLVWYDNLKFKIKQLSKSLAQSKNKIIKSDYFKLQREYERLSLEAVNNTNFDTNKFEEIKVKLRDYENKLCRGAILRSKAYWAIESDKNTKYFLELEKYRQNNNCIKEIKNSEGTLLSNTDEILDEVHKFYKDLYSCTEIDKNSANELLENVSERVNDEDMEMLESDITMDEIKSALFTMAKNKSPGPCGLTVEFFCKFFHLFEEIFSKVFKVIENGKILSRSMRHGIINLVYKNKGDKNLLKNFRPISLLCVDYKIIARIMSNRLKTVLPKLVSESQTCCIMGRDIADTTSSIRDLIEIVEKDNLEAYLIKVDQEKAFDRVDHEYLFLVLEKFGFGPKFIQWIKTFYFDVNSSVKCNGFLTKYVKLQNSIKQGCPVSALLYVLCAEPLGQAIMKNKNILGVRIPNSDKEGKIFQHADDTNIFTSDKNSINESFKVLELYSKSSGAKINNQKSEIMCLGSGNLSDQELNVLKIQKCENVTKVLGIYVGKDKGLCESMNWNDKLKKMKSILFFWNRRQLTLPGRATVLTSLIMSRFFYTLTVCPLPEKVKNEIRLTVLKFLWNGKSHLVKYQSIIGPKNKGGLNIPDIYLKMQAFRLKFLRKFLDGNCGALWKYTFRYFISKVYNFDITESIVYAHLSSSQVKHLPMFYQEMLQAFYRIKSRIKFEIKIQHVYNNPIFRNPAITHNEKMLLFPNFVHAGLIQIKHLCYEVVPGFLRPNAIVELVQLHNPKENTHEIQVAYQKILQSIPDTWKTIISGSGNPVHTNNTPELKLIAENDREVDFMGVASKDLYSVLLSFFWEAPIAERYWAESYPPLNFTRLYSVVNQDSLPPDCHCLFYRMVHRSIFTLDKLAKFRLVDSSTCKACKQCPEDLLHLFVHCPYNKAIHNYLKGILHDVFIQCSNETVNNLDYEQLMIFGYLKSSTIINTYFLNYFLCVARHIIYKSRNLKFFDNKDIDSVRLFKFTIHRYIEYAYAFYKMKNRMNLFNKYFLHNNTLISLNGESIVFYL